MLAIDRGMLSIAAVVDSGQIVVPVSAAIVIGSMCDET
jgi:hypothetical protein